MSLVKNANLILIRHGQSAANANREIYYQLPDHDIPITELGAEQARKAGLALRNMGIAGAEVIVSPYTRAQQTWEEARKHFGSYSSVEYNPLIREQEYKFFDDADDYARTMEFKSNFGDYWWRFKSAESQADVFTRMQTFCNDLRLRRVLGTSKADNIVIISHEIALRSLLQVLGQDDIGTNNSSQFHIDNCQIIQRKLF